MHYTYLVCAEMLLHVLAAQVEHGLECLPVGPHVELDVEEVEEGGVVVQDVVDRVEHPVHRPLKQVHGATELGVEVVLGNKGNLNLN